MMDHLNRIKNSNSNQIQSNTGKMYTTKLNVVQDKSLAFRTYNFKSKRNFRLVLEEISIYIMRTN